MQSMRRWMVLWGAGLVLAACATSSPPQEEVRPVVSEQGNAPPRVAIMAMVESWPGESVTAVRVTIMNDSAAAIRIQYGNMHLLDQDGNTFSALPVVKPDARSRRAALDRDWEPLSPAFKHKEFAVAPVYEGVYTAVARHGGYFPFDAFHYDRYYPRWGVTEPTSAAIREAVPEGVLRPTGRVSGLLFFERVRGKPKQQLQLNVRFENAEQEWGQEEVAIIEMPLRVYR